VVVSYSYTGKDVLLYNDYYGCSHEEERVLYLSPWGGDKNKRSKEGAEKRACLRGKSVKRGRGHH
jgi:hypothetical protein